MKRAPIILIDDDRNLLEVYEKLFKLKGFEIKVFDNGTDALAFAAKNRISVAILDVIMPIMDGMTVLERLKEIQPGCEVIMLTAEGSISGAVSAVKRGAYTYLVKPADIDELILNVKKAEELFNVKSENTSLRDRLASVEPKNIFVGDSKCADDLRSKAEFVGDTESTVMITGETGVGKEVIAKMIHSHSKRADKPFICVNCGALNENLIERELFGSEKGAYTGSTEKHMGRFELADGGTLFFDEVGELSLNMQVKLLRVLQEKTFERVGGNESLQSDFRLITATNKDLKAEVEAGRFRADLYYRINIIPIQVPPLRERIQDIPVLCEYFLKLLGNEMNRRMEPLGEDVLSMFLNYSWPGNVRELRNILERLVVLSRDGIIDIRDIPDEIAKGNKSHRTEDKEMGLKEGVRAFEKEYIEDVLRSNNYNVAKAAQEMKIARQNLYKKINEYNIRTE